MSIKPRGLNGATFEAGVKRSLVSEMPERAVVVMDNLSANKGTRVRELIKASGGEVLYLPPYFPGLNPIE